MFSAQQISGLHSLHGLLRVLQPWQPCAACRPEVKIHQNIHVLLQGVRCTLRGVRFQHNHYGRCPHNRCASGAAPADCSQQTAKPAMQWADREKEQLYGASHVKAVLQKLQHDPHVQAWSAAQFTQSSSVHAKQPVQHRYQPCPDKEHAEWGSAACLEALHPQQKFRQVHQHKSQLPAGLPRLCSFSCDSVHLSSNFEGDSLSVSSGHGGERVGAVSLQSLGVCPREMDHRYIFPSAVRSISWPGCGTLFFWQLGVMSHFCKVLSPVVLQRLNFIGSSSGALLSVLAACGVVQQQPRQVISCAADLCHSRVQSRRWGLYGIWGDLLQRLLEELLPPNAADLCNAGRVVVLLTAFPWLYNLHVDQFHTRADVIQAVLASAHIPLLMDGKWSAPQVMTTGGSSQSCTSGLGGMVPGVSFMHHLGRSVSSQSDAHGVSLAPCRGALSSTRKQELPTAQPCGRHWSHLLPWMPASRVIDGNFWYTVKQCYHGLVPADGDPALIIEPRQDVRLQHMMQGVSPIGKKSYPPASSWMFKKWHSLPEATCPSSYARHSELTSLAACPHDGRVFAFSKLASYMQFSTCTYSWWTPLKIVTEAEATELFEIGQQFACRMLHGDVMPLHLHRRLSSSQCK